MPVRTSNSDYELFAAEYPLFYKNRILIPFLPFYRIILAAKSGKLAIEWKTIRKHR